MGFSVSVYGLGTEENFRTLDVGIEFFEDRANLVEFTADELQKLRDHLETRKYEFVQKRELLGSGVDAEEFHHRERSIIVLLTDRSLHFEASGSDATMDASELRDGFTVDAEMNFTTVQLFSVFDPHDGWL